MEVYHLGHTKYANQVTGEGARLNGGRWNHVGVPCIYASETRARGEQRAETRNERQGTGTREVDMSVGSAANTPARPRDAAQARHGEQQGRPGTAGTRVVNHLGVPTQVQEKKTWVGLG